MKICLGVETTSAYGSLCLRSQEGEGRLLGEHLFAQKNSSSEIITSAFQKLLSQCQASLSQISKIEVAIGPGSFTGIRVGLSFAKTLSMVLKIPIVPVSTLRLFAEWGFEQGVTRPLVFSRALKNYLYVAGFEGSMTLPTKTWLEPKSIRPTEIDFGLVRETQILAPLTADPALKASLELAFKNLKLTPETLDYSESLQKCWASSLGPAIRRDQTQPLPWPDLRPLYVRSSEAEEKLRK